MCMGEETIQIHNITLTYVAHGCGCTLYMQHCPTGTCRLLKQNTEKSHIRKSGLLYILYIHTHSIYIPNICFLLDMPVGVWSVYAFCVCIHMHITALTFFLPETFLAQIPHFFVRSVNIHIKKVFIFLLI